MNDYEELVQLLDRLDAYRAQRKRLLWAAFWYLSAVMLSIGVLAVLKSRMLYAGAFILLIGGTVIGLLLLSNFIKNEVAGRELERDVRNVRLRHQVGVSANERPSPKQKKRKRKNSRLAIGDDGELVEVFEENLNSEARQNHS